jgi:hypothetical protein
VIAERRTVQRVHGVVVEGALDADAHIAHCPRRRAPRAGVGRR